MYPDFSRCLYTSLLVSVQGSGRVESLISEDNTRRIEQFVVAVPHIQPILKDRPPRSTDRHYQGAC